MNLTHMTIISTTVSKNPLEEMEQPSQSKIVQNEILGYSLKNDRTFSLPFQGKPFKITVIQGCAPTSNAEEAEAEWFYEGLQDLLELTLQNRCPFHYRGLKCKSRKSRVPLVTGKFGLGLQNEAGQSVTEFCQENTLVIANTFFQQQKRGLSTWTSPKSD